MRNLLLHYCRSEKLRGSSSLLEVSEAPGNSRLLGECMMFKASGAQGWGGVDISENSIVVSATEITTGYWGFEVQGLNFGM